MKKCGSCDKTIPITRSFCSRSCVAKAIKKYLGGGAILTEEAKRRRKAEIAAKSHANIGR